MGCVCVEGREEIFRKSKQRITNSAINSKVWKQSRSLKGNSGSDRSVLVCSRSLSKINEFLLRYVVQLILPDLDGEH